MAADCRRAAPATTITFVSLPEYQSYKSTSLRSNVELVQKYYDKTYVTTIAAYDGDSWRKSSVARTISE